MKLTKKQLQEIIVECVQEQVESFLLEKQATDDIDKQIKNQMEKIIKSALSHIALVYNLKNKKENHGYGIYKGFNGYNLYSAGKIVNAKLSKSKINILTPDIKKKFIEIMKADLIKDFKSKKKELAKMAKLPPGPMGKILFGAERNLPEPDTSQERQLFNALDNQIDQNEPFSAAFSKIIQQLLAKGLYKDIVVGPSVKQVYRGMNMDIKHFAKFMKKPINKLTFEGSLKFKKPFVFNPRKKGGASSWTWDQKVAKRFSKDNENIVEILLVADVAENKNKLFDLKKYYQYFNKEFKKEKEVIGLGPIKVKGIIWKISNYKY